VLTASFTIETWFRSNVVQVPGCASTACNLQRLWSDYNYTGAAPFRCYIGFYNVGANFLGGGFNGTYGATGLQGSTAYVLDGQWHHSALVYDQAAGTLTSYVDGNLDQQATGITTAASPPATANFIVGASGTPTTLVPDPFNGTIDEFRWWGEARSQLQIQNGMLGEIPEPNTRALFAANRRSGPAHLVVAFKDFSVAAPGTSIAGWLWDFGDGQQSIAANPCHVYTAAGNYTVTLTVTDTASGMDARAFTNYINVGPQALTVHSCGQGDLYMATPTPPPLWGDAFTVLSQTTSLPAGYGWFFGLVPDTLTFSALAYPAVPGSPLHALNVANPALWPESPLVFPPGTFTNLSGLVLDAAVVYRDPAGIVIGWTSVSRARF
jgi:PKD repeat protein